MWIDCHCHVEQLPSPEKSIQEAQEVGVSKICAVSETLGRRREGGEREGKKRRRRREVRAANINSKFRWHE